MGGAAGQLAAAGALRVFAGDGGQGHRRAPVALRIAGRRARRHRGAAGLHRRSRTGAGAPARGGRPQAVVLFGLSAQYLDAGAGRLARHGRHRLPLHGDLDGPQHAGVHADGRRGRAVAGAGAVHRGKARVRQPRRRHLLPFGPAGDPRGGGGQGADHLQDPVQRRGGHDRRAAGRRPHQRADDQPPGGGRGHRQDRGGDRRAGEIPGHDRHGAGRAGQASRRAGSGDARTARTPRRVGTDLRPDLCHREAPPPQARRLSRPGAARGHQRTRVRRLWRLFAEIALPVGGAAGDRVRAQARHQPVQLQQGLLLSEGLLPQLRHGGGWQAAQAARAGAGRRGRRRRAATGVAGAGAGLWRLHRRRGRHRRGHHRPVAGHGRAPGRQGLFGAGHGRPGAEGRRGVFARGAGADAGPPDEHPRGDGRGRPDAGRRPGGGHQRRRHGAAAAGPLARAAQ